ncbi:MAG: GNAT family N-acetyltransferase [Candidatus Hodarchaeota archaeon]
MTSFKIRKKNLKIRKGNYCDINDIHSVLLEAFKPYKKFYTSKALIATILTPDEIKNRLGKKDTTVSVVLYNNNIVGTVTIFWSKNNLFILSMAVKPNFQGKGIGKYIIEEIIKIAKKTNIKYIFLESFLPLTKAVNLYNQFGFNRTGKKRNYFGIEIFEMKKKIR